MENLEYPLISVIMPTFNREKYIKFAIESILNQTFTSFEFIIIDDCSNDATYDIIREYAKIDQRIIVLRNKANKGIVFSLNKGLQLSRGKYIARMDDDDISMPTRLEKQFQIMEKDDSIIVAGTYFKYIGRNPDSFASWVNVYEHDMVKIKMMFECPICHPSVIMRKNFFKKYNLKYSQEYQYAEDYKLWLDVLQNGGKIINIPEILLLYRATNLSISRNKKTSNLQQIRSRSILFKCRELFLDTKSKNLLRDFCNIPMELSKKQEIYKKIQRIQIAYQGNRDSVQKILQYFCGVFSDIHICFIFDNIQLQGLINGIFSILKNSSELDRFHFYILHNGSFQSEFSILKLRRIKDFELSIIDICKINNENISQYKTLYFKFLFALTQLKIEKCLLISSRFVVMDSLNFFWNADFEKKIIVATSSCNLEKMELFRDEFLIQENFESNVIMINLEYLLKNNFLKEILFYDKTFYFHNEILSKEEIIMNLIFKNNWKKISLRYNVQSNLKFLDNLHPILFSYQKLKDVRNKIYIDYIKENHYMRIEDFFEDNLINDLNYLSAVDIIKNSLSYKIGMRIIQSKTLSKILILPFALCNIIHQDYIEKKIRKNLEYVNPIFSTPNIEECYDYLEGEKMKKHLAYQLGECFLEHPFFFILYFIKIYINWKKNGKR